MFDGSHYAIEENIEKSTKLIADANAKGISVECEVGSIGGEEDGVVGAGEIADPAECKQIADLGTTMLAAGTGIPEDMIKKAISLGVAKINVNTECQLAFAEATRKYIEAGKDLEGKGFDPRKLLAPGFEAIKATVKEKMELFGSVNQA